MHIDTKTRALMPCLILGYLAVTGLLFVFAWLAFLNNNGVVVHEKYNWYVTALYLFLTV